MFAYIQCVIVCTILHFVYKTDHNCNCWLCLHTQTYLYSVGKSPSWNWCCRSGFSVRCKVVSGLVLFQGLYMPVASFTSPFWTSKLLALHWMTLNYCQWVVVWLGHSFETVTAWVSEGAVASDMSVGDYYLTRFVLKLYWIICWFNDQSQQTCFMSHYLHQLKNWIYAGIA